MQEVRQERELVSWGDSGTNAKVDRVPRKVGKDLPAKWEEGKSLLSLSSRRAGTWKEFERNGCVY